ncbi:MAG: DUF1684 domain-containing protein [Flavobacteriaceae bacterium]|nr:DUF1684 domain-containing protein [Flavobacteriaceae bacterium]
MKNVQIFFSILLFTTLSNSNLLAQQYDNNLDNTTAYKKQIEDFRKQKDIDYMIPEKTMLTKELMEDFKGLKYFPIDSNYNLIGKLTRLENLPIIKIKTSTGKVSDYAIYGKITFEIGSKSYELSVYQSARLPEEKRKTSTLFLPFTDQTSGDETYGGGRYLVLDNPEGNFLTIDFNMTYNPYCVYNPNHSCPIPPMENDLPIKILAGELMY